MRVYLLSLGTGILVGVIYSLLNVRSPAPPMVALVRLFGILIGEQIAKHMLTFSSFAASLGCLMVYAATLRPDFCALAASAFEICPTRTAKSISRAA